MNEGDVILTPIPQADGKAKNRPAIVLREMPGYGDLLVCGVSTQVKQYIKNFDEIISPSDDDFQPSGLLAESVVRLGFLAVLPIRKIAGSIGSISGERHKRLLASLSNYLIQKKNSTA